MFEVFSSVFISTFFVHIVRYFFTLFTPLPCGHLVNPRRPVGRQRSHEMTPQKPERAILVVKTSTRDHNPTRRPPREKKAKMKREREKQKQKSEILASPPFGPTLCAHFVPFTLLLGTRWDRPQPPTAPTRTASHGGYDFFSFWAFPCADFKSKLLTFEFFHVNYKFFCLGPF